MNQAEYAAEIFAPNALTERVKPTVKYVHLQDPVMHDSVNIVPIDHPVSSLNGKIAHTSYVVAITEDGFETRNTKYVKGDINGLDWMRDEPLAKQ